MDPTQPRPDDPRSSVPSKPGNAAEGSGPAGISAPTGDATTRPGERRVGWRTWGGVLAAVGFVLSPLSWWNDLFVNVPLALLAAWAVSWLWPAAFTFAFVSAYWLTNVLGLILLQKGARLAATGRIPPYTRRELIKDLLIALGYTGLIFALARGHILQPLQDYL